MTIKVRLNCQWDNGREILPPGTETELDRDQAFALADMGMVKVLIEKKPAEPVKVSTATKPAEAKGRQTKKSKEAEAKAQKAQEAEAKAVAAQAAEQEAVGGDDSENDSDDVDKASDPGDSDDAIPDPDSLVEA